MNTGRMIRGTSLRSRVSGLFRLTAFILLPVLVAWSFYLGSSAKTLPKSSTPNSSSKSERSITVSPAKVRANSSRTALVAPRTLLLAAPPLVGEDITTYESSCTTPQTTFNLGDTICAKVSNSPLGANPQRSLHWVGRTGIVFQPDDVVSDPQTFMFTLPMTPGSVGEWKVTTNATSDGSLRMETFITVKDPGNASANLSVSQGTSTDTGAVGSGSTSIFNIFVRNSGPDAAVNVSLADTIPAGTTFVSMVQDSGPEFTCATESGVVTCTLASMAKDESASFSFAYNVDAGTLANTVISNSVAITSATADVDTDDNQSTATSLVPNDVGSPSCTLTCPLDMTVVANTTVGGEPGAYVNYAAASGAGSCGAVSNDPASSHEGPGGEILPGRFFNVGTHLITSNSETGDSCTFTVTVVDSTPPTISCPPNKTVAAASGQTTATVDPGTPTTVPSTGVTVTFVRSDDLPNDGNPPPALTDPYPLGTTNITWTVTDVVGLTASCVQQITVVETNCANDTTAPTITAPADVTVGTGPDSVSCSVALDDELGQPTATDDCTYTISTSGIPPGNAFPVGTTNITYTATDAAGNHASAVQHVTVVDNTPPVIEGPANASYTCPSEVPAASPSQAQASDNCGTPTVTVSQSSSGAGSAASPLVIVRTYTATDSHGNSSSAVQTITVIDPVPPTFTFVPGNVTAYTGPGATTCGTVVSDATLGTATASDNCSVTVTRSGVPAGNTFPKGNTTITYTATDGAGNSVSATQTVTVIDNTPPIISCQADIVVPFDPAINGAVVTYTAPVGTDNCAGATTNRTAGLASGSTFPLGTTTNTFTVTDASGLTASCSFKVTVALTSLIGLDSVSITGSGQADSYNSTGGYPATKSSLASVVSNGTITLGNSGKVWGSVRSTRANVTMSGASQVTGDATAGTTVTTSGSATIGGTRTNNALAPLITLPSVVNCGAFSSNSGISGTYSYNAGTGDLSLSGVNIATLANGTYCFHNVTLTNSAQLKVNGTVTIKLTGTLNTSGATSFTNTTGTPANLRILSSYSGSNGITFGNSTNIHLMVYAPNTGVSVSGAAPLFGTVAGKTLTISNSGAVHYDTTLTSVWPDLWSLILGN